MVATALALLFTLAAITAITAIVATARSYAPDIVSLYAQRLAPPRERYLTWRIVQLATGGTCAGLVIEPRSRAAAAGAPLRAAALPGYMPDRLAA